MKTYRTYDEIPQDILDGVIMRLAQENISHVLTLPGVWEAISEEFNNDALDELCPDPTD